MGTGEGLGRIFILGQPACEQYYVKIIGGKWSRQTAYSAMTYTDLLATVILF